MRRFAITILSASLAFSAMAAATSAGVVTPAIDTVLPPVAGGAFWSGDRMRDARERLKDILPGSFS